MHGCGVKGKSTASPQLRTLVARQTEVSGAFPRIEPTFLQPSVRFGHEGPVKPVGLTSGDSQAPEQPGEEIALSVISGSPSILGTLD